MEDILNFWFQELEPNQWWSKDDSLDQLIKSRFEKVHKKARNCELYSWRNSAEGQLAEIIVLDQFSRNMFRNTPESFNYDSLALALAQNSVAQKKDLELEPNFRSFLYMPYMHSESLIIHDEAVLLFEKLGNENSLKFEHAHRNIILKFGRYPHRNLILNRSSTPEELEFLKQPNSGF